MSKGSKQSGTQTTTTEPPDYLKPYLQYGVQQATNQYQNGGQQYYPGNNVVPFSPATEQAMGRTEQRSLAGSPVTSAAQGYATGVLSGNYLMPQNPYGGSKQGYSSTLAKDPVTGMYSGNTAAEQSQLANGQSLSALSANQSGGAQQYGQGGNPYIDAAFNHAALGTQNQLASQFAGAGRNIEGSQFARGEQLNNLANQFYYQNYNDERNRQQQVLPYANSLANQDYTDIAQQANVGSQVEGLTGRLMQSNVDRFNFAQNQPGQNLDQYLNRLTGGYPGQQQTSPVYQNRAAGALGGALTGAQVGSTFGPWGTAIGAVGGGLLGGWS